MNPANEFHPNARNRTRNIPMLSSGNEIMLVDNVYPDIPSLHIVQSIQTDTETQQAPPPNHNSQSDGPSERRIFGRNVRRLLKIVHLALMNPSELMDIIKIILEDLITIEWSVCPLGC
jgi:hypothetical protein